jgi:transposase
MTTPAQRAHINDVKQRSLERIQQVIALTNQGMTQRAACDKLGLNHYVMSRNIRRWKREQMTEEEAEMDAKAHRSKPQRDGMIFDDWGKGMEIKAIALGYCLSINTVNKILRRNPSYKPYGRE